jgi:hypothetical protein
LRKHYEDNKYLRSDEKQDQLLPVVNAEEEFKKNFRPWVISDDSNLLLGSGVMVASNIEDNSLAAVAV